MVIIIIFDIIITIFPRYSFFPFVTLYPLALASLSSFNNASCNPNGKYLTFLAAQIASMFAVVPPLVKCPMHLSFSYPIITHKSFPTSTSNLVVTVEDSAQQLF